MTLIALSFVELIIYPDYCHARRWHSSPRHGDTPCAHNGQRAKSSFARCVRRVFVARIAFMRRWAADTCRYNTCSHFLGYWAALSMIRLTLNAWLSPGGRRLRRWRQRWFAAAPGKHYIKLASPPSTSNAYFLNARSCRSRHWNI